MGMNKKYFVNNGVQNSGPFDLASIVEQVKDGTLKATDHLYMDDREEWIMICQHSEFSAYFEGKVPNKTPPTVEVEVVQKEVKQTTEVKSQPISKSKTQFDSEKDTSPEWFLLKEQTRYGPFHYLDIIRMLQEKSLFEYDFVWRQGLDSWKRVAEVSDFSPIRIREVIKDQGAKHDDIFYRRKHTRSSYECSILAHDNQKVWKGRTVEISEGGAGVIMDNATLLPGQNIYVHFKPGVDSRSFNVLCEVVSKRYVRGVKSKDDPVVYGIRFINIHKIDKDGLKGLKTVA